MTLSKQNNMTTDGLQSKRWTGYFDEATDSIVGDWRRCAACQKIPSEIYYLNLGMFQIWRCQKCSIEDVQPKSKFLIFVLRINNLLN